MIVLIFIYLLAMVCWLGLGNFFFVFHRAGSLHGAGQARCRKVVSVIFPRYYILGYIAGGIAFIIAIYLLVAGGGLADGGWRASLTIGIALGCTIYAGTVVRPRVDAIRARVREANPDPRPRRNSTASIIYRSCSMARFCCST